RIRAGNRPGLNMNNRWRERSLHRFLHVASPQQSGGRVKENALARLNFSSPTAGAGLALRPPDWTEPVRTAHRTGVLRELLRTAPTTELPRRHIPGVPIGFASA